LAFLAQADIIYSYTGNPFTNVTGSVYSTTDSISGFFTLTSALGSNFSFQSITPKTFSFTDQHQTLTDTTPSLLADFQVSTDAAGNIDQWEISILTNNGILPLTEFSTQNLPISAADAAVTTDALGNIISLGNNPAGVGVWTTTSITPVPEPNSLSLLVLGVLGIAFMARKRTKQGNPPATLEHH
jgi:PEP-CTERM motif